MNKLFEYRCFEYIEVAKSHRLSVWGMEGHTDEENSQGNKLALKQMSLREAVRVHSPCCFQIKKCQIMMRQSELVGQLGRYSTLGTENTDVLGLCPVPGSLSPSSLSSPTPSPFISYCYLFLSFSFPFQAWICWCSKSVTQPPVKPLNESEVEAESLKLNFYNC